jgi:phosphatidylglycerophosphatase A
MAAPALPPRLTLRAKLILALSSALGLGYLPAAPGTWGTLAAIPIWYGLSGLSTWAFALATAALVAASCAIADAAEKIYGAHDAQRIVIDEVAGLLTAAIGVPFAWPEVVAAFVAFRLLDMTKPGPIGWIDRHVHGGVGVVLDDVAAGALTAGALHVARLLIGRWW